MNVYKEEPDWQDLYAMASPQTRLEKRRFPHKRIQRRYHVTSDLSLPISLILIAIALVYACITENHNSSDIIQVKLPTLPMICFSWLQFREMLCIEIVISFAFFVGALLYHLFFDRSQLCSTISEYCSKDGTLRQILMGFMCWLVGLLIATEGTCFHYLLALSSVSLVIFPTTSEHDFDGVSPVLFGSIPRKLSARIHLIDVIVLVLGSFALYVNFTSYLWWIGVISSTIFGVVFRIILRHTHTRLIHALCFSVEFVAAVSSISLIIMKLKP